MTVKQRRKTTDRGTITVHHPFQVFVLAERRRRHGVPLVSVSSAPRRDAVVWQLTRGPYLQGIDIIAGGRNKKTCRTAPKSNNVYLALLVKVCPGRSSIDWAAES
jgi:hypothetical protein